MTFRDEERRRAILEASKEKINQNGMPQHSSPISTRTAAEAQRTMNAPDVEPALRHVTGAGTGAVAAYPASVRDRIEHVAAKKRDLNLTPAQTERQRLIDFYEQEYRKEQKAEADRKAAEERARQQKAEAERKQRELEATNQRIQEQNMIRAEIRRELADATAEEIQIVIERVRAERCEGMPAAYGIHLAALREERRNNGKRS